MFDDRLEILSYGGMPYSQTKERFLQGISVPRNLALMRVFQDLEIMEKTGHGTVKIISAYGKEAFDIQDGFIQVTIPFNKKVMKNRGTLNGTLKNIILRPTSSLYSASFFLTQAYRCLTLATGWGYPEGPLRESSHRFRIKESSREMGPKSKGAGKSSNKHF